MIGVREELSTPLVTLAYRFGKKSAAFVAKKSAGLPRPTTAKNRLTWSLNLHEYVLRVKNRAAASKMVFEKIKMDREREVFILRS